MKDVYKKDKKSFYLLLLGIFVIITMVVGATFAYFSAQGGGSTTRNVNVTSNTTDLLTFEIDNDIELEITQADFALGNGNKSGDTDARAILRPNNYNGEATDNYYMYLNIESNPIVYSSTNTNHDPELLLQVFDEDDNLVEIDYFDDTVEYDGLEGYDITGVSGLIPILENYEIEATNNQTETQEWHIVITMINLDVDQEDNTGKEVEANIKLQKEAMNLAYTGAIYRHNNVRTVNNINYLTGGTVNNVEYTGVGDYSTDLNTILNEEKTKYCIVAVDANNCDVYYNTYDSLEYCEGGIRNENQKCIATTYTSDVYIKHDIVQDIITNTYICRHYNNNDVCLDEDYFATHEITDLKDIMEEALDTQAEYCDMNEDGYYSCWFGGHFCTAFGDPRVDCESVHAGCQSDNGTYYCS